MSTSSSSMSTIVASATVPCFRASRRVAPSPPPQTTTFFGWGCRIIAGWLMHSWNTYSSRIEVWML